MDLKSNIFWAVVSVALIGSALILDPGPARPLMAEYSESSQDSTG